jgi:hypothetical protein
MKNLFKDILSIDHVRGAMLIDFEGQVLFQSFLIDIKQNLDKKNWASFIEMLSEIRETDLIFEKYRFYIRKTEIGYLVVMMGRSVPIAILRLNCDILLPSLKKPKVAQKGLKRFFNIK